MSSIEIADAYVALRTEMPGVKKDIENALGKVDTDDAGGKIADGVGKGITNKQAAIAGAVGGIFGQLANMGAQAIGDLFADAVAQSDASDKFAKTLDFAGLDTSAIDTAMAKSKDYADSTVYDLSTIQNTTAQLAANGVKDYSELTEAAGNLNAVAGGNQDTFSSVAQSLSQTAGAGKLTTENWNQLADAIPGASGRLQDALSEAGAYTGNFRDAMAEGQITADEFNAALLEVGTEPVAVEAATSVETMEGATGNLAAAITGQLADAFTTIKPVLTGVTSVIADFIANSDVFIPVITGLATALLVVLAPSIWAAVTATWAFTAALLANPLTWVFLAVAALVAGIVALAMNWDTVVAWITDVWSGFLSWLFGVIDGFNTWWDGLWTGILNGILGIWQGIVDGVTNYFDMLWLGLQLVGQMISDWWNGLWTGIGDFFSGIWNGILETVKNVFNGIIDFINGAIEGINGVVGIVGGALGFDVTIPTIPRLADGGVVRGSSTGTLAVVGEAGRGRDEAVLPLPPDWRENGIGGGRGGPTIIVNPSEGMSEETIGQVAGNYASGKMRGF